MGGPVLWLSFSFFLIFHQVLPLTSSSIPAPQGSLNEVRRGVAVGTPTTLHSLPALVDKSCGQYCGDQTQHNNVCLKRGCGRWRDGLRDGCFITCTGVDNSYRENYACQLGCSRAVDYYYAKAKGLLSRPEPPTLLSGSLGAGSLRLGWEVPPLEEPLSYLALTLQKRVVVVGPAGGEQQQQRLLPPLWETLEPPPQLNTTSILIKELRPYTQYQFRLGYILATDFPPIFSREGNPIQTLAKGLPSPPEITSIQSISNTSVAVNWSPPPHPNGKLIAYILRVQPMPSSGSGPSGAVLIKEIPISQQQQHAPPRGYTFSSLIPQTNYSIALSAQNMEGEGKPHRLHFITQHNSPSPTTSNNGNYNPALNRTHYLRFPDKSGRDEPKLLVAGIRKVYRQPLDLLLDGEPPLFTLNSSGISPNITGMDVHLKRGFLFVSTTDGDVRKVGLQPSSSSPSAHNILLRKDETELAMISHVAVDWLHDKLYIVGKRGRWTIKRCELDGSGLSTFYHLQSRPLYFAVDPYTGYLYWVTKGGLYKLDLVGPSNSVKSSRAPPVLLHEGEDLGPFTLDHPNLRLLLVDKGRNSTFSVSLDGEVEDVRRNTVVPQWGEASSLATHNNLLYWTTPTAIVSEEYNGAFYYQNSFGVGKAYQPLVALLILSQPVPTPSAPPAQLQIIYGVTRARITWKPPPPISALGDGAWSTWSYQVRTSDNRSYHNITNTELLIHDLRPSTFYTVQVSAYSEGGRGPFCPPKRGKTLRSTAHNVSILWGAEGGGLWKTDTLGDHLTHLAPTPPATSIAWLDTGLLFYAATNGSVFYSTVREDGKGSPSSSGLPIPGITYASSLAYDYIGERLYWSDPKEQTIYRCPLRGAPLSCPTKETLQLVTMAKEIAVDSYRGLLLWTTGHSIEMSRLNGYAHGTLHQNGLFSGKQIMGMTLDTEGSRVYWITLSASGSLLQRLQYHVRGAQLPIVVGSYGEAMSSSGPIRYFNDRLLWLEGAGAAITDLSFQGAKTTLSLSPPLANLTNVFVRDQGALKWPPGILRQKLQVVPSPVPLSSIQIREGDPWDNFTVVWSPVSNTNWGKVLYEVGVVVVGGGNGGGGYSRVTEYPNVTLGQFFPIRPFTEMEVSVTPLTYWGSAKGSVVKRRSPQGLPTEPLRPRLYRAPPTGFPYQGKGGLELRWDPPTTPNGIILRYNVHCWRGEVRLSSSGCGCEVLEEDGLSCLISNASSSSSFTTNITIQGETVAGSGPYTMIQVDEVELRKSLYPPPVPRLLLTSVDKLEVLDVDRMEQGMSPLPLGFINPTTSAFSALDSIVFWFNEGHDLFQAKIDGGKSNKTRLLSLPHSWEPNHLSLDWIGKRLYWSASSSSSHAIMVFDLSTSIHRILPLPILRSPIKGMVVNPLRNAVYWSTPRVGGYYSLLTADGRDDFRGARPFLSRAPGGNNNCNCSRVTVTGEPLAFDPSPLGTLSTSILFLSGGYLVAADEEGCTCHKVVDLSSSSSTCSSPSNLAADHTHIYLVCRGALYSLQKMGTAPQLVQISTNNTFHGIVGYGEGAQPFPPLQCLLPTSLSPPLPILLNTTSGSLRMSLPLPLPPPCPSSSPSLPSPVYRVHYGEYAAQEDINCSPSSPSHCSILEVLGNATTTTTLTLSGLLPYTPYTIFLTATNPWALSVSAPPLISPPVLFRTAAGAPLAPKLLRLQPLSPFSLRVVWGSPERLNGEKVWYEVGWNEGGRGGRSILKWAEIEARSNGSEFYLELNNLTHSTPYTVWVRAYSEKGDAFSESPQLSSRTRDLPPPITLHKPPTPHRLFLNWRSPKDASIIQHEILFKEKKGGEWEGGPIINYTKGDTEYPFTLQPLRPKTTYLIKLRVWYGAEEEPLEFPLDGGGYYSFMTLADKPSPPQDPPGARGLGEGLYQVWWGEGEGNGAPIQEYQLETKQRENKTGWWVVYNGTDRTWVVDGLDPTAHYAFRLRARNRYGWGPVGDPSPEIVLSKLRLLAVPQEGIPVFMATLAGSIIILGVIGAIFFLWRRRMLEEKPSVSSMFLSEQQRQVELATLSSLPASSTFIHQPNLLYSGGGTAAATAAAQLDAELMELGIPKVAWSQLLVTKFLGSGAFGEVYEGIALNLGGGGGSETRVAIKTLRKGASGGEKLEFAQEAKLMAQFRHPHIIQLMGICVDTDPCYLLLELMEGGDLLSYLRTNRPGALNPPLNLVDLLGMCTDVARGCVYLEELHFVHRDIAARNCLVSLLEGGRQIVKLGDFGLARDIYRNDYYRKDGEGLLPVRWMAPESLVDGIFTTQSDVWAFGVLIWEIMTLGQQPYPAQSNVDVLHYVRGGGRLGRPPHCPHILGNLMVKAWEYGPENRPSFKECLHTLEVILEEFMISSAPSGGGLGTLGGGVGGVHFDPYSYSDNYSNHVTTQEDDPFPAPPYMDVLSSSEGGGEEGGGGTMEEEDYSDYEIPKPKRPPRRTPPVIGLPSPSSWVAEGGRANPAIYRNLQPTAVGEEEDEEEESGLLPPYNPTHLFNNHMYAAQHLQNTRISTE